MKLIELFGIQEAPLADFQLHGDWSDNRTHLAPKEKETSDWEWNKDNGQNSFVSKVDRKMVQDISTQSRLTKLFAKHDVDFYLYMVNTPEMEVFHRNIDFSEITPKNAHFNKFPEELQKTLASRFDAGGIQIVLTHNEGGKVRHALTPWMICHRMAHALLGQGGESMTLVVNNTQSLVEKLLKASYDPNIQHAPKSPRRKWETENMSAVGEFFRHICTFKSARDNDVLSDDHDNFELFVDAFTQYFVKGQVTFNAPPEKWTDQYTGQEYTCVDMDRAQKYLDSLTKRYNRAAQEAINFSKGKIWVC